MCATERHRGSRLSVAVLAAFFVLAGGGGAALPAVGEAHPGGHVGGFAGGGHPRGRVFEDGRFRGQGVPHRHRGPEVFVFPYLYDPYDGYGQYYPGEPYDAYCDTYSPWYNPQYCFWDGGP